MVQMTNNNIDNTSKKLSIQVSLNGLSFCTRDAIDHTILTVEQENFGIQLTPEQILNKIKYTFDTNSNLKENFETVEVIYQNDLYTLVPKPLFDENQAKEYLNYTVKVFDNDFIAFDELNQHDIITVYIPYANIHNFFFETFGSFTYKHSTTILTNALLSQEKNSDDITVFANMNSKSFDLFVINKGRLILSNTYNHETKEDFLYYLMFATEQLQLNPEEYHLVFLGDIKKNNDYHNIAHQYIRKVSFSNHLLDLKLSTDIRPIEPHQHFVLLSLF